MKTLQINYVPNKYKCILDYAPSFREMGEEIENAIQASTVSVEESNNLHLSPAHQLVINSIWTHLNVLATIMLLHAGNTFK